ncbi:phosphate acetyltransferase [Cognatishimia sp.]|uniref:phosphate acetyltransferase n=1 Tax=Cognatishimia sp. TaxID=2211648 RepID=UPI0035165EB4
MTSTPVQQLQALAPKTRATIALSEGSEPRTVAAALVAAAQGLADIILVGDEADIRAELSKHDAAPSTHVAIQDPKTSDHAPALAKALYEKRKHKGMTKDKAAQQIQDPLLFAAALVHAGLADGTVGGAVAATADIIRPALQMIGKAQDAELVSSFFLMLPPETADANQRAMVYADCGFVVDPSAPELAAIAASAAKSADALLAADPVIAMLSFSTFGSAKHSAVDKVQKATKILRTTRPDLTVDGELQFDAAFNSETAARKAPQSPAAGRANVMVFPTLDAGNIAYKITERVGGYTAIGPILQGLAKPANDLSRGCTSSDIVQIIAVTVLQSLQKAQA